MSQLTIIVVLAVVKIRVQVAVINPHIRRIVDGNSILSMFLSDQTNLKVANDHIINTLDQNTGSDDVRVAVLAKDRLVAAGANGGSTLKGALNVDDQRVVTFDGLDQLVYCRDGDFFTTGTTSSAAGKAKS